MPSEASQAWGSLATSVCQLPSRLLRAARGIVQRDFSTTPFIVAAAFYLLMTLVLTYGFQRLEKKYAVYDE